MNELPDFGYIGNSTLRNWNQLNIIYNLNQMGRNNLSRNYGKRLSKRDKFAVLKLDAYVNDNGYENTRREIFRKLNSN